MRKPRLPSYHQTIAQEYCFDSLNIGKINQLRNHGLGLLHSLTWAYYNNEGILLRHVDSLSLVHCFGSLPFIFVPALLSTGYIKLSALETDTPSSRMDEERTEICTQHIQRWLRFCQINYATWKFNHSLEVPIYIYCSNFHRIFRAISRITLDPADLVLKRNSHWRVEEEVMTLMPVYQEFPADRAWAAGSTVQCKSHRFPTILTGQIICSYEFSRNTQSWQRWHLIQMHQTIFKEW